MDKPMSLARRIAQECACIRVRQASRVVTKIYDAQLRETGLQDSQFSLLVALAHFGEQGASLGTLAEALVVDRTTLTRNLKPLEASELVLVARSPHDARARMIVLSRAGERMIERAMPLWERAQAQMRDMLGPSTLAQLLVELRQLVAASGPRARHGERAEAPARKPPSGRKPRTKARAHPRKALPSG